MVLVVVPAFAMTIPMYSRSWKTMQEASKQTLPLPLGVFVQKAQETNMLATKLSIGGGRMI